MKYTCPNDATHRLFTKHVLAATRYVVDNDDVPHGLPVATPPQIASVVCRTCGAEALVEGTEP